MADFDLDTSGVSEEAWQRYDLTTLEDGRIVGRTSTNDNLDHGYPSEYAEWDVSYRNHDQMRQVTGLTHYGCSGIKVTVVLDGVEV